MAPRVPLFIPDDFEDRREIIRFNTLDGLCRRIDAFLEGRHHNPDPADGGRLKLLRHHLTTHRAAYFLNCITKAFNC
jgi:hypothetical protein